MALLRPEGERLPVGLSQMKQMALVPLQKRTRHLDWSGHPTAFRPEKETLDVLFSIDDRSLGVVVHSQPLQIPPHPCVDAGGFFFRCRVGVASPRTPSLTYHLMPPL